MDGIGLAVETQSAPMPWCLSDSGVLGRTKIQKSTLSKQTRTLLKQTQINKRPWNTLNKTQINHNKPSTSHLQNRFHLATPRLRRLRHLRRLWRLRRWCGLRCLLWRRHTQLTLEASASCEAPVLRLVFLFSQLTVWDLFGRVCVGLFFCPAEQFNWAFLSLFGCWMVVISAVWEH